MKAVTLIFAACFALLALFMPVSTLPASPIAIQGRSFNSRFAPPARPVFPRSVFDNYTTKAMPRSEPNLVERNFPLPTGIIPTGLVKRTYPAGPTASALVFRSEHMDSAKRL